MKLERSKEGYMQITSALQKNSLSAIVYILHMHTNIYITPALYASALLNMHFNGTMFQQSHATYNLKTQ